MSSTRDAVLGYIDALNSGDPDRVAACVTEDFHNEHTSVLGRSLRGRAAYRERLPGFLAEFAGLRYDVEPVLVDGDRAAAPYRMTFRARRTDGKPVDVAVRGVFVFRVAGGLVAHRVDYWDSGDYRRQLEAAPPTREDTAS